MIRDCFQYAYNLKSLRNPIFFLKIACYKVIQDESVMLLLKSGHDWDVIQCDCEFRDTGG